MFNERCNSFSRHSHFRNKVNVERSLALLPMPVMPLRNKVRVASGKEMVTMEIMVILVVILVVIAFIFKGKP